MAIKTRLTKGRKYRITERRTGRSWLAKFATITDSKTYLFTRGSHAYFISRFSTRYDVSAPPLYRTRRRSFNRRYPENILRF